jgi:predicted DsbA family dithiol-disulfide isomerase
VAELASERPDLAVTTSWRPFLLRPDMPEGGIAKAPDTPGNPRVGARLKAAGLASGVDFTGLTDRAPNPLMAHAMAKYLEGRPATQDAFMFAVFRHYFTDGKYPDATHLREAASEAGLEGGDLDAACAFAEAEASQAAVKEEALGYSRKGVSGVPFFSVGGRPGFSGAQPAAVLKRAILDAAE